MSIEEYFKDWTKVIDKNTLFPIIKKLESINPNILCPSLNNIFKAFELCSYRECIIVFMGQDPYPQKNKATGILFGNNKNTEDINLSPSLKIIKDASINLDIPHYSCTFDPSLENWAKQGILMLNSVLTTEVNKIGIHSTLWRPFIAKLLKNLSINNTGLIYVLFGTQAQTFEPYINKHFNFILKERHPAYYARTNIRMSNKIFKNVNDLVLKLYNKEIKWYNSFIN